MTVHQYLDIIESDTCKMLSLFSITYCEEEHCQQKGQIPFTAHAVHTEAVAGMDS